MTIGKKPPPPPKDDASIWSGRDGVKTGIDLANSLMKGYFGFKQLGLAEKDYKLQRDNYQFQKDNTIRTNNQELWGRQNALHAFDNTQMTGDEMLERFGGRA